MTIYRGKNITPTNFFVKMQEILLAEGYEDKSNPNNSAKVYLTKGIDGKNPFYVYLTSNVGGSLTIGIYENWDGVKISEGDDHPCINWHYNSSADGAKLDYTININKDRIIVAVVGVQGQGNSYTSLMYAGLIKRYDSNDIGGGAATLVFTTRHASGTNISYPALLRDRMKRLMNAYQIAYGTGSSPMGWGNKLLASPLNILASSNNSEEGMRGELDDLLYVHRDAPYQTGDVVTHEGNQYMAIRPTNNRGYRGMAPNNLYLLKI